ncbi:hypothetical protein BPOR_0057g00020 [Botrytis porri]|uniref:Urea active transporter n=1 Tax=Botrytis porri TaxID=87229 RepID=A0A4Z1L1D0_9HELO|nr:hypothetical protein BPOR_0057g00020 [Botrytis porri]
MPVQLLTQADGYGIIVGLSILFCLIILAAVRIQKRYLSEDSDQSEMFMVANRSVGTGLTASAVFSSWMWINKSVFSAAYTYKWGIALPICMILAGAQLVRGMTGMHVVAACVLIPVGVVIYTAVGGLKATFLTDFLHTTVALILLIYFSLAVLTNEHIGGISGLYEKVKATDDYIPGNYEGSLLTMKSKIAVLFGLVLKFGNLALVLMDTAFWQKSFASEVHSTVPAYDLVSIVIIAIPWCTGTIIGLSARAIEKTPIWFDYPNTLTTTQVNSGMVMPYILRSLLGQSATTGLLVLVFMAITSTVSSSMIAVSSIISLDLFRTYINPAASDRKTLKVSHWGVVFHGCFMAGFAIMLEYAGATNNWSTYFRPIIACPGILPMIFTLLWSRQTKAAAILAPILGLMSGVATWLSLSWYWSGALNIQTTQVQVPGLYGAIVSFFSPGIYSIVISMIWPSKFDWREFLRIGLIEDKSQATSSLTSALHSNEAVNQVTHAEDETKKESYTTSGDEAGPPSPPSMTPNSQLLLDDVVHPQYVESGFELVPLDTTRYVSKHLELSSVQLREYVFTLEISPDTTRVTSDRSKECQETTD